MAARVLATEKGCYRLQREVPHLWLLSMNNVQPVLFRGRNHPHQRRSPPHAAGARRMFRESYPKMRVNSPMPARRIAPSSNFGAVNAGELPR